MQERRPDLRLKSFSSDRCNPHRARLKSPTSERRRARRRAIPRSRPMRHWASVGKLKRKRCDCRSVPWRISACQVINTPNRNRTCNLPLRRRLLYPVELWGLRSCARTGPAIDGRGGGNVDNTGSRRGRQRAVSGSRIRSGSKSPRRVRGGRGPRPKRPRAAAFRRRSARPRPSQVGETHRRASAHMRPRCAASHIG
jgi:hypothetical protein